MTGKKLMMKIEVFAAIMLIFVIVGSGCVEQSPQNTTEITEITIPGHPIYVFSNDVRTALKYNVTYEDDIRHAVLQSGHMNVIFNGSSAEDDTYFSVVLYNVVQKIQTFFVYEGGLMKFDTYYSVNDTWYGTQNNTIPKENITSLKPPIIEIRGPNTGATSNEITFDGRKILIQGQTYKNLTLAGDKLALIVMGIKRV
jgi:hypothetical protein